MADLDIVQALYELKGSVDATHKNMNEKFDVLFSEVSELKQSNYNFDKRLTGLELNWAWVIRLGGLIGGLGGILGAAVFEKLPWFK